MNHEESEVPSDEVAHHDDRTLRLTVPLFTPELLGKYLEFQETSLAHAESGTVDEQRLAAAHRIGVEKTGLTSEQVGTIGNIVRAFAGTLWTISHLERRLGEIRERLTSGNSPSVASDEDLQKRLNLELTRLKNLGQLVSRYGRPTIEVMQQHEKRIVALHERTGRVFRGESRTLRS